MAALLDEWWTVKLAMELGMASPSLSMVLPRFATMVNHSSLLLKTLCKTRVDKSLAGLVPLNPLAPICVLDKTLSGFDICAGEMVLFLPKNTLGIILTTLSEQAWMGCHQPRKGQTWLAAQATARKPEQRWVGRLEGCHQEIESIAKHRTQGWQQHGMQEHQVDQNGYHSTYGGSWES